MANATSERFQDLVKRNADEIVPNYVPPPLMKHIIQHYRSTDDGVIFIIACADSRADPTHAFGLKSREASVIRCAGGRVSEDTFRSLEIMGSIVNIGTIVVIHHTDCGGLNRTDDEVREINGKRSPEHKDLIKDK